MRINDHFLLIEYINEGIYISSFIRGAFDIKNPDGYPILLNQHM